MVINTHARKRANPSVSCVCGEVSKGLGKIGFPPPRHDGHIFFNASGYNYDGKHKHVLAASHKSTPHDRRTSPHLGGRQIICIRIDRTGQIYGHSPRTPPKSTLVASFLGYSNTFKLNWVFLWSIPVLVKARLLLRGFGLIR